MDYSHSPGLLIVSDSTETKTMAERAGARILAVVPIPDGPAAIGERSFDALLVEAEADSFALPQLLAQAGAIGARAILSLPPARIDLAWSLAPEAHLLSNPTPDELVAAITAALAPVEAFVAEHRAHPEELLRLSAEAGRIAQALAELSFDPRADAREPAATQVRALIKARRLRDRFLDAALFADPAWDMMLDLYAARIERKQVAVSSLCIAAAVPTTTALRWLRALTDAGVFLRIADPSDGRRFFVALADPVSDGIAAYFAELGRLGLPSLS